MTQLSSDLPTVRLRPKADARRIRHGHPWAYASEIVTDRRTKALAPGSLAILTDDAREPLALVTVNPTSRIFARVLDRDISARIDQPWFERKLSNALHLRKMIYADPFYRLIHAEGDGLPGIVIDRFGDVLVIQPNAAWADVRFDLLSAAAIAITGAKTIIKNASGRARALEGLDDLSMVHTGPAPVGPVGVPMNGALYLADLMGGQKTGLFFDQRPNHAFAQQFSQGARVLDVFSHVGGFGLAALAQGAKQVAAVDGSSAALSLAADAAQRMGQSDRFVTRKGDAFDELAALFAENARFDMVICDPPAFAPSKPALDSGLRAYEKVARLAAPLVEPGGILALCSCSHAADLDKFRTASVRGIGKAGRAAVLLHTGFAGPDHPQLPQLAETGYLKALFFRL